MKHLLGIEGLEGDGRPPVVGVERSESETSEIGFFTDHGTTATVDSADLISGRVALVYALAGSKGNYGIKSSADRLLPGLRHPRPPAQGPPPRPCRRARSRGRTPHRRGCADHRAHPRWRLTVLARACI